MTDEHEAHERATLWFPNVVELANHPGNAASFTIVRTDDDTERSFSAEALEQLHADVMVYVCSRIMRAWNESNEAPSVLTVDVRVTVT